MKREPQYEIERPSPGVITYREGHKEHQFPIFEQDGETVFVEWPTPPVASPALWPAATTEL